MTTALNSGVTISLDYKYEDKLSNPLAKLFLYSYGIRIENKSKNAVQLLSRYWKIVDSNTHMREVQGEGVIGEQPVISPGGNFSYRSSCDFTTDMGKMSGYYVMKDLENELIFKVQIPEFSLIVPFKLN